MLLAEFGFPLTTDVSVGSVAEVDRWWACSLAAVAERVLSRVCARERGV